MTIGTFLGSCQTDETRLRITARGKGRVYDGTIKEFKTEEEFSVQKSKLAMQEIYIISFDGFVSTYDNNSRGGVCGANFEPVVIIVI